MKNNKRPLSELNQEIILNGETFVPFKKLFGKLKSELDWNDKQMCESVCDMFIEDIRERKVSKIMLIALYEMGFDLNDGVDDKHRIEIKDERNN